MIRGKYQEFVCSRKRDRRLPAFTMDASYLILSIFIILCTVLAIRNRIKRRRHRELISKLPSLNYTIIGYLSIFFRDVLKTRNIGQSAYNLRSFMSRTFEKDGIYTASFAPFIDDGIVITGPRAYRDLFMDQDNIFKNISYTMLAGLLGKRNLILSGGEEWKQDRKVVNPSFKYSNLISMNGSILKRGDMLVDMIRKSGNAVDNMHPMLALVITHVILESASGRVIDPSDPRLPDFIRGHQMYANYLPVQAVFPIFFSFPALFYATIGLPLLPVKRRIRKFISEAADLRMDSIRDGSTWDNKSLIDSLIQMHLKNPEAVPKVMIIDQVMTFVFAGHKATSYTLNAILMLLASHPEKQKILQQELDEYFNNNPIDDSLDMDSLNKLTYLTAVIKEGQRLYPISSVIGRKVTKEFVCSGYTIPVGCELAFDFDTLTKHPESFPYKPYEFIPERFVPGGEGWDDDRHPFAFLPFAHGLRKCVGEKFAMNMLRILLIKLVLNFDMSTTKNMDNVKMAQDIMVYIQTAIDIKFEERGA